VTVGILVALALIMCTSVEAIQGNGFPWITYVLILRVMVVRSLNVNSPVLRRVLLLPLSKGL
jgi:hypothetical protein